KQQSGRRGLAGSVVQNASLYPAYAEAAVAEQKQQHENRAAGCPTDGAPTLMRCHGLMITDQARAGALRAVEVSANTRGNALIHVLGVSTLCHSHGGTQPAMVGC